MTIEFDNLHTILRSLYQEMMPLCSNMAGVAKGIAGLGALFYVAVRVWQSLARAEAIDVYPLLRPFAVGFCIMFFPTVVLGTINGVLSPVVQGTNRMLESQTLDMNKYREQKDKLEYEAMMRNPETAYLVSNEEFDRQLEELGWSPGDMITMAGMYIERGAYNMKKGIRDFFPEVLELLFAAAALLIDTLRTFFLIVLSILGPIAFAISVWDGFHSTLTQWLCRYVQIYLWLPVADLFSTVLAKIQVLMLQNDISELQNNPNFSLEASNGVYIVFLIIGIIGYFTIPTVAGWIIQAGGSGSYGRAVTQLAGKGTRTRAPLSRAVLHPLAGKERDRAQYQTCPAALGQECLQLLHGFLRERLLQPYHRGQHQSGVAGRFGGLQLRPLPLRGQYLRASDDYPREQRDGAQPRNALPSVERLAFG